MSDEKTNPIFQQITSRFIKALEAGTVPWRKPWKCSGADGFPMNLRSGKPYKNALNALILAMSGRTTRYWLSANQVKELYGRVKKGELPTAIMQAWVFTDEKVDEKTGKTKTAKRVAQRLVLVYNLDQTENCVMPKWHREKYPDGEGKGDEDQGAKPIEAAELIVRNWEARPPIAYGGDRAFYQPGADRIQMPKYTSFKDGEEFYSTLFHELTHSTGHQKRLNREGVTQLAAFGSPVYSREELVAEIGAAYITGILGFSSAPMIQNQNAYVTGWLKKLRSDPKLIVEAAGHAQKAATMILGTEG